MNVFNREMKKRQKNWSASLQDGNQYDYLRDEVCHSTHTVLLPNNTQILVFVSTDTVSTCLADYSADDYP